MIEVYYEVQRLKPRAMKDNDGGVVSRVAIFGSGGASGARVLGVLDGVAGTADQWVYFLGSNDY